MQNWMGQKGVRGGPERGQGGPGGGQGEARGGPGGVRGGPGGGRRFLAPRIFGPTTRGSREGS